MALTRRTWAASLLVGALPIAIRLTLLPWWPIPRPAVPDEFCYLYPAETFAAGQVANPGHPLWQFFEAPHLVVHPLVYSKYLPA